MGAALNMPWLGATFDPATPLDIATLQAAVVTALATALANQIEVAAFPDKPEAYRMTHRVGCALIRYDGDEYDAPNMDAGIVAQARTLRFQIGVIARDLGWAYGGAPSGTSPGAYSILESIRHALTGLQIPGCEQMYPLRTEFEGRDAQGGAFYYSMYFATPVTAVQIVAQPAMPTLTQVTAKEEGGITQSEETFEAIAGGGTAPTNPNN